MGAWRCLFDRRLGWGVLIFFLPIVAALAPMGAAWLLVPRGSAAAQLLAGLVIPIPPGDRPEVAAAMYSVAVAATITIASCAISLAYSLSYLLGRTSHKLERRRQLVILLSVLVVAVLLFFAWYSPGFIDDELTRKLFCKTRLTSINPPWAFDWDAKILGFLVYTSFAQAALAVAVASVASEDLHKTPPAEQQDKSKIEPSEEEIVMRATLFLTATVLVSAMITAKFRFAVGLAAIGPAQNAAYIQYNVVSSSVAAYWAAVLSLSLAFIYVPSALRANFVREGNIGPFLISNRDNLMRLLRFGAILAPPIINKLIDLVAGVGAA
jgi:hypothetical protein